MWEVEIFKTKQHAIVANEIIENLTQQFALYPFNGCTERTLVALALLKASIDTAAAATRLLIADPVQYGGAAEAMLRPQIERYMRGVFFGSPSLTNDAEVHAFFENDKMPERVSPNRPGSKRPISFDQLAQAISAEVSRQAGGENAGFAKSLSDALTLEKDMHGAVHGGRIVIRRYLMADGNVAHNPWSLPQGALIAVMMHLALLAFSQVAHLHGSDFSVSPEFDKFLREVFPGMPQPKSARGP